VLYRFAAAARIVSPSIPWASFEAVQWISGAEAAASRARSDPVVLRIRIGVRNGKTEAFLNPAVNNHRISRARSNRDGIYHVSRDIRGQHRIRPLCVEQRVPAVSTARVRCRRSRLLFREQHARRLLLSTETSSPFTTPHP
jgi:hypothetical protein